MSGDIGGAIREGFKLLSVVLSGAEKRRMRSAIEAAEEVFLNIDMDWIEQKIRVADKEEKKKWQRMKKLFDGGKEKFFECNN